jgi:hypothetical protein
VAHWTLGTLPNLKQFSTPRPFPLGRLAAARPTCQYRTPLGAPTRSIKTMQMTKTDVLNFIRTHSLAVQSSVSPLGRPQSAVIGFVVSDDFHIFFDTIDTTRKVKNLRQNPMISFVIGGLIGGDERTVQYEGIADEPKGKELDSFKELYFTRFPDGRKRQSLTGLIYIRAKPIWVRYSDFNQDPVEILEFAFGKQVNGS